MKNNEERKNRIIKRIEEQTKDVQNWPDWRKDINLTDASTFTISIVNHINKKVKVPHE